MPQNKRESLIFTVMMCFFMVFFMSIYNVACHHGALNLEIVKDAWIGFPIAYCFAMCCDWFLVSGLAKGFAFRFLVKPESEPFKKAIAVSCCMVVPMVIIMSFYGAMEAIVSGGAGWNQLLLIWITNIPRNFIMALPLQLLIAGPFIRGRTVKQHTVPRNRKSTKRGDHATEYAVLIADVLFAKAGNSVPFRLPADNGIKIFL